MCPRPERGSSCRTSGIAYRHTSRRHSPIRYCSTRGRSAFRKAMFWLEKCAGAVARSTSASNTIAGDKEGGCIVYCSGRTLQPIPEKIEQAISPLHAPFGRVSVNRRVGRRMADTIATVPVELASRNGASATLKGNLHLAPFKPGMNPTSRKCNPDRKINRRTPSKGAQAAPCTGRLGARGCNLHHFAPCTISATT